MSAVDGEVRNIGVLLFDDVEELDIVLAPGGLNSGEE